MRRLIVRTMACGLLIAGTAAPLAAQGTIRGTVADSGGSPLPNASVSVDGTSLRISSGNQGEYELRGVPAGSRTVRVRLIGFQASSARVNVVDADETRQDFTLGRSAVQLAPIDVVIGSRARHTAEEELAVPVDIIPAEILEQQGSTETGIILQTVSPSINFPRQSVTDANDIVRPFTLRGLSPDHTLVLVNGWRRHQTAVLNTFAYGTGAGSSGVDLNAFPASALERVEVLRDGASAQYGSDAIAGVVNLVVRDGAFSPFVNADVGRYVTADYPDDGTTFTVNGGWGIGVGRGSLGIFAEYRDRDETNRAWADPFEVSGTGVADEIDDEGNVITKNNPVPQPNHHWGDGEARDILTFANFRHPVNQTGSAEVYAFGGYSFRNGTGNGYRRYADDARNWPQIYPLGFLPEFDSDATDYSAATGVRGVISGWNFDLGATLGHNHFDYNLTNTLNSSLGPCLDAPCAPGTDGMLGTADDPGIPNQTAFFAGRLRRDEFIGAVNVAKPVELGLPEAVNLAFGAAIRREAYKTRPGELASYIDGGSPDQFGGDEATSGSQVFAGFGPTDATDVSRTNFGLYADAETNLSPQFLANVAARLETYSDFGERVTGKVALRYQPSRRLTFRAAAGTGFRAPGLSQVFFSHITTNVIFDPDVGAPLPVEVGNFPVDHPASRLLGSRPLDEETSFNFSGGLAVTPAENLTLTADYFHITIDDRILLGATFDDDATVQILSDGGFSNIGAVQYFTNGLDTKTQGVDFTANLQVPVGTGRLDFNGYVNYTKNEITRVDPLPQVLQDAGSTEPGLLDVVTQVGIEEERPDWRATLSGQYSTGRLRGLARMSYFGQFASAQPGFCDDCREEYGARTLFDAEVGYQLDLVHISLGVRNIFDTYPDQASEINSFLIFPWAAASPFGYNGRYIYARTEIRFNP